MSLKCDLRGQGTINHMGLQSGKKESQKKNTFSEIMRLVLAMLTVKNPGEL